MNVKETVTRANNCISINNVLIRNEYTRFPLYFGPIHSIPSQFLTKEVKNYLYNASRALFILKIST